jgi:hypothetical protein
MSVKHDTVVPLRQGIIANLSANDGGVIPPHLVTPLSVDQMGFVRRCVDVIYIIFSLYGFSVDGVSRKSTYDHWIYCASLLNNPMKFVKYKIAAFYSFHKKQQLPKISQDVLSVDKPGIILGGKAYKWFNIQINRGIDLEGLITSVLYSKKGMPRPNKTLLKLAEKDAFEKLTTAPLLPLESLIDWADIPDRLSSRVITSLSQQTVHAQIVRTVKEIFDGQSYDDSHRVEPFFPSTSANYINTRGLGGAVGCILEDPDLLSGLKTQDELLRMKVVNPMSRHFKLAVDTTDLRTHFISLYARIVERALNEEPIAVPLALPEALKTRVISKGPPFLYTALKPLQKRMWTILKSRVAAARLISEPVTAEYIQSRMGSKLKADEGFLSVDYSDATNEMFSWCSESAMVQICESLGITDDERKLCLRALTGHIMEYDGAKSPQLRGQLMGSIVSFPILCIINLAICRWSMEVAHKRVYTLDDAPIAVNGDDGILRINESGKRAWERIASYCGLSPSVGKVYFSRSFLNMNSTTYNYHPLGWEGYTTVRSDGKKVNRIRHFELVQYVNLGLLFNFQRSGGGAGTASNGLTIGDRCRELIRLCPSALQERVLSYFLCHNRDVLGRYHIPWFIPERLGGMGFPTVGRFQPVDKDLRLARKIFNSHYTIPARPVDAPWQVWKYATKRFPYLVKTPRFGLDGINIPTISPLQLLGFCCAESIFRVDSLADLFQIKGKSSLNYFGTLSKLWKKALLNGKAMPEPFDPMNYPPKDEEDVDIGYVEINALKRW